MTTKTPSHAKNVDRTAQKAAFVEWLVAAQKEPRTQVELAAVLGVDSATLSDWKRDEQVLGGLKRAETMREVGWARAYANLERIACQTQDNGAAVQAIREMGKLLKKYPSEKVEVTTVERVAYVEPNALRELAEVRPN